MKFYNYKVNKKKEASKVCFELVKFIKKNVKQNYFIKILVKDICKSSKIPQEILNKKIYQILYYSFNFKKNKFENYNLFFLVIDFLKYYFFISINIIGFFIFPRKKKFIPLSLFATM